MKVCFTLLLLVPFAQAANPPVKSVPFTVPEARQPEIPDISLLRLETSRCFTTCPAFTVSIRRDGSFSYQGEDAVERLGEYQGQVERGELEQILRYVGEIGFMDLENRYSSPFLDNGGITLTVVQGGKSKTVESAAGSGPATLWALTKLIDGLLERATWELPGRER